MMRRGLSIIILMALPLLVASDPIAPPEHRRGEEQTYLTFPEWFLVFSPAEYAQFVQHEQPSAFPFWGHIGQFWESYRAVHGATVEKGYPFNGGYHVMIMVIGTSTTVEYAIRSAYETLVGRLAELTVSGRTAEDDFGAKVAQDYVDFIRERPWYEFDFWSRITGLWSDVSWSGPGFIRKLERRYALTSEYLVKAGYGWLIGKGTQAGYERPLFVTAVVTNESQGKQLHLLPRYEPFTSAATQLARGGADFVEVAGNPAEADVLISVLASQQWNAPMNSRVLFTQDVITQPDTRRFAIVVSVGELARTLRTLEQSEARIEHLFDY